ncbi:elongation factor P [Candidatus Kaiserbacteria bacterium]|nr:MAG: elongation factor P [Candidatus Kaiserbacteria bacterium]
MAVLAYNEITLKKIIIWDDEPFLVLASHVFRKQKRKPVNVTKLKSLVSGRVVEQTFHSNETADEADMGCKPIEYIYESKGEYWFNTPGKASERFAIAADVVGDGIKYIKPKTVLDALLYNDNVIGVKIPVKVELMIKETAPAVKGNTSGNALKDATLETGAKVMVPLFINEGDVIRVNTESGEYTERAEKA